VVLLVVAVAAWLFNAPEVPEDRREVAVEAEAAREMTRRRVAPVREETQQEQEEAKAERPDLGARSHFERRLAEEEGELYVYCFVGEELSDDKGRIDNGWFSMSTEQRTGSTLIGPRTMDAQMVVHWEAPEDATEVRCTPEQPTYGYVTVHVNDEGGEPLKRAAVNGCGTLNETGDDGVVEIPVLVQKRRCDMEIIHGWDENTHYQGYARILPLAENEARTLHVTAAAVDTSEEGVPLFDLVGLDGQEDVPVTGVLDVYVPEFPSQGLEDYEDRLASSEALATTLQAVLARTPEEERWAVEEEIERNAQWIEDFRKRVTALRTEAEAL